MRPGVWVLIAFLVVMTGAGAHAWWSRSFLRSGPALELTPYRISLNTADVAALSLLPEVGPKTAEQIVEYRRRNGPFTQVEQLEQVRGIGPRTLARVRPFVKLD